MKYTPLAVVLAALLPSLAYAQNTQFSDCRTLEAAGNNVGPDEALVDGMVCKVVKPKARSWVSSPASGKTAPTENLALLGIIEPETLRTKVKAEVKPTGVVQAPTPASGKTTPTQNRMALLGIIEPETLRSKLSAEANAAEKVATPKTGTEPEPETEPGENVTPQSARFAIKPAVSLGEIARAYQKNSQVQAAAAPEDIVEPKKPTIEAKLTAAPTTTTETSTTTLLPPGQKANGLTAAQAPKSEVRPEETPAAITPAPVTAIEPQPAAQTEVFRAPQTPAPAVKAEATLRAVVATPATAPEAQSGGKTEVFGSAAGVPPSQVREASPVAVPATTPAPAPVTAIEPQPAAQTEVFRAPQTPAPAVKAEATLRAVVATPATTPEAQSGGKTEVFGSAAGAPPSQVREASPVAVPATTPAPAPVTAIEPQPAAQTEVFRAPQTPAPAVKAEATLRAVVATPATAPEAQSGGKTEVFGWVAGVPPSQVRKAIPLVAPATTPEAQSDGKTGVFAWVAGAPPSQLPEASPLAVSAVEDVRTSELQKSISLGVFVAPETSSPELNRPPDVVSYGLALEDGFNDGQRAGCTKNVSLGSVDKERLFLAIPEWAANWYEKNQKRFPGMCFSDSPMLGAQNYLVVFYTSAPAVSGIDTLREISAAADMSPRSGVGTFTTNYGSTWHYTFDRTATTTVTTVLTDKVPHSLQSNVLYATAYSERGIPISQHWPTAAAKNGKETSVKHGKNRVAAPPEIRIMSDLLTQMAEDIAKL
ncbi:MAG: hypothetical protein DMG54_23445 [Acidobacteria bacterium]|nr:MAG: hypothetical protein DMG54_23445 [Acidobacteriota bacterium]